MKNQLKKELKKININFDNKNLIKKPLKILKKINFDKFKKITSFSLNKTIKKFKETRKKEEINKIKLLKKEKVKEAKKEKLEKKKLKLAEAKKIKKK